MERRNECRDRQREREEKQMEKWVNAVKKERRDVREWGARDVNKLKPLVLKVPPSMSRVVTSPIMDDSQSADLCHCHAAPEKWTVFLTSPFFHASPSTVPSFMSFVSLPAKDWWCFSLSWTSWWLPCLPLNLTLSYRCSSCECDKRTTKEIVNILFLCMHESPAGSIWALLNIYFLLVCMCVVLSRAHVHCGAGRRSGSDSSATHLPHLALQMLQDRADAFLSEALWQWGCGWR